MRKLELDVSEQWWTERGYLGAEKCTSVLKMPGVAALEKIEGLEAVVFRNCPTLQQTYEAGMLQQVRKKVKRVSGRKPKVDQSDDEFVLKGKKAGKRKSRRGMGVAVEVPGDDDDGIKEG